ncbi:hypothetical protein L218DRAFT_1007075 [Marasmius fiardii PR-910]|nr:hypothetical protein L218DRAFT_1007075 [Marasmius fiardii PR-910]
MEMRTLCYRTLLQSLRTISFTIYSKEKQMNNSNSSHFLMIASMVTELYALIITLMTG